MLQGWRWSGNKGIREKDTGGFVMEPAAVSKEQQQTKQKGLFVLFLVAVSIEELCADCFDRLSFKGILQDFCDFDPPSRGPQKKGPGVAWRSVTCSPVGLKVCERKSLKVVLGYLVYKVYSLM